LIGEDPNGIPNNLMPYIAHVAVGRREHLNIFGGDYGTPDGTGVRDYIHVVDLAKGHLAALNYLAKTPGLMTINLGTGQGLSVLDMLNAFQIACGIEIPYQIVERRAGDIACCYANPSLAAEKLGWHAELGVNAMCHDAWRWQSTNLNGYDV
jgi:UDP-glucose 4-epimerase